MSRTDYPLDKIRAIVFDVDGVLSPSCIPLGPDGIPNRMVNIKDGYAIKLAIESGLKLAIISGARSEAVELRFKALGMTDIYMGAGEKLQVLINWMTANELKPEEVAFCGDDIPDYRCMEHIGLSVAPHDAAVEIRQLAHYVSPADGGHGVARDIIEQVLRVKGKWMADANAFGW